MSDAYLIQEVKKASSVEESVQQSSTRWSQDLHSLFENAEALYGDVAWVEPANEALKVWGHKAMIYARAPKSFRDERPKMNDQPQVFKAEVGDRPPNATPVPQLFFCGSSELLKIYVKWIYTAQGFGAVADWAAKESTSETQELMDLMQGSQSLGEDRLRQDLIYMWRSKLYADVQIHVSASAGIAEVPPFTLASPASTSATPPIYPPSPDSVTTFTAHSFILASRSRYMAAEIQKITHPSISTISLTLPLGPFTTAALHFCLGYIYTGSLNFSNRGFDMDTALQIYASAFALELDELRGEIESRIVYDFCHGLDWNLCHCNRCLSRVLKLWAYSLGSEIGQLAEYSSTFMLSGWSLFWESFQAQIPERSRGILMLLEDINQSFEAEHFRLVSQGLTELLALVNGSSLCRFEEHLNHPRMPISLGAAKKLSVRALTILVEHGWETMWGGNSCKRSIGHMLRQAMSCLVDGTSHVHEDLNQSMGPDASRSQVQCNVVKAWHTSNRLTASKDRGNHQAPEPIGLIPPALPKSPGSTPSYNLTPSNLGDTTQAKSGQVFAVDQLPATATSRRAQKLSSTLHNLIPDYESAGIALRVPIPCVIFSTVSKTRFKAEVVYVGCVKGLQGPWVGIHKTVVSERYPKHSYEGFVHHSPRHSSAQVSDPTAF
ncbi:hypothetical protein IAR50_006445 [Cryptococcus sp. DSM 104548]